MPQLESYGIDGHDFFESPYEKVVEIPFNRVLFTGKFTDVNPTKPELAQEVRSLSQLFEYYKPIVKVPFRNAAGKTFAESFRFHSIDDFAIRAMEGQSNYKCIGKETDATTENGASASFQYTTTTGTQRSGAAGSAPRETVIVV